MLSGIKILVVEDDLSSRELLKKVLLKFKAECVCVRNGKEALDILGAKTFDLILLDIKMPILNGYEAIKLIKEKDINTPVIAQTAYAFSEDRKQLFDSGFDGYIAKPINREILLDEIQKVLLKK